MPDQRPYPRVVRVNEMLREVVAEQLERVADDDERLGLLTVTGVDADPDLRKAKVYFASVTEEQVAVLSEHRVELQKAIARQARLKRTPQLSFDVDPGVSTGLRVEELLRGLNERDD